MMHENSSPQKIANYRTILIITYDFTPTIMDDHIAFDNHFNALYIDLWM